MPLPNEQINDILLTAKKAIEQILQRDVHIAISDEYKSYEQILLDSITKIVAEYYNIQPKELRSNVRKNHIVMPRQVCMYIAVNNYKLSTTKTSHYFKRNHATVIYSIKTLNNLMSVYPIIQRQINDCIHLCNELITFK